MGNVFLEKATDLLKSHSQARNQATENLVKDKNKLKQEVVALQKEVNDLKIELTRAKPGTIFGVLEDKVHDIDYTMYVSNNTNLAGNCDANVCIWRAPCEHKICSSTSVHFGEAGTTECMLC